MSDYKNILGITISAEDKQALQKKREIKRKPKKSREAVSREVLQLIENTQPPKEEIPVVLKSKNRLVIDSQRTCWEYLDVPINGRADSASIGCWRMDNIAVSGVGVPMSIYAFDPPLIKDDEYRQLVERNWTKESTERLLRTCALYNLSFPAIADRFEPQMALNDLKKRMFDVCKGLVNMRTEKARKRYETEERGKHTTIKKGLKVGLLKDQKAEEIFNRIECGQQVDDNSLGKLIGIDPVIVGLSRFPYNYEQAQEQTEALGQLYEKSKDEVIEEYWNNKKFAELEQMIMDGDVILDEAELRAIARDEDEDEGKMKKDKENDEDGIKNGDEDNQITKQEVQMIKDSEINEIKKDTITSQKELSSSLTQQNNSQPDNEAKLLEEDEILAKMVYALSDINKRNKSKMKEISKSKNHSRLRSGSGGDREGVSRRGRPPRKRSGDEQGIHSSGQVNKKQKRGRRRIHKSKDSSEDSGSSSSDESSGESSDESEGEDEELLPVEFRGKKSKQKQRASTRNLFITGLINEVDVAKMRLLDEWANSVLGEGEKGGSADGKDKEKQTSPENNRKRRRLDESLDEDRIATITNIPPEQFHIHLSSNASEDIQQNKTEIQRIMGLEVDKQMNEDGTINDHNDDKVNLGIEQELEYPLTSSFEDAIDIRRFAPKKAMLLSSVLKPL